MFKIFDRFIYKQFLGVFFFINLIFAIIIVVFDLTDKLDNLLQSKAPWSAVFLDYYSGFIPFLINMLASLLAFVSVIFFTSRMANRSEVIAFYNGGLTFRRFLQPFIVIALSITLLSLFLANYLIPATSQRRIDFEYKYIKSNPFSNMKTRMHKQIEENHYICLENYSPYDNSAYNFTYEELKDGFIVYKLRSDFIKYDSSKSKWTLKNYEERSFEYKDNKSLPTNEIYKTGNDTAIAYNMTPIDFARGIYDIQKMPFYELNKTIATEKEKGSSDVPVYENERQRRLAEPLSIMILTLIAVPLSAKKIRGGMGAQIALGLVICFSFVMMNRVSAMFAVYGNVNPIIATWVPDILYTFVAIYILYKTEK